FAGHRLRRVRAVAEALRDALSLADILVNDAVAEIDRAGDDVVEATRTAAGGSFRARLSSAVLRRRFEKARHASNRAGALGCGSLESFGRHRSFFLSRVIVADDV